MSRRTPRTKTGQWLVSSDGLDPDGLSYHDVNGDRIDIHEIVARIEDEAQSKRWPSPTVDRFVAPDGSVFEKRDGRVRMVRAVGENEDRPA